MSRILTVFALVTISTRLWSPQQGKPESRGRFWTLLVKVCDERATTHRQCPWSHKPMWVLTVSLDHHHAILSSGNEKLFNKHASIKVFNEWLQVFNARRGRRYMLFSLLLQRTKTTLAFNATSILTIDHVVFQ